MLNFFRPRTSKSKSVDVRCKVVEGVLELAHTRRIAVAEPDVIRRDDMKLVRELRDQITEHMRRAGKTVQQHDGWRLFGPCLTVEHLEAANGGVVEMLTSSLSL